MYLWLKYIPVYVSLTEINTDMYHWLKYIPVCITDWNTYRYMYHWLKYIPVCITDWNTYRYMHHWLKYIPVCITDWNTYQYLSLTEIHTGMYHWLKCVGWRHAGSTLNNKIFFFLTPRTHKNTCPTDEWVMSRHVWFGMAGCIAGGGEGGGGKSVSL